MKNGESRTFYILKYGKTPIQEHGVFLDPKKDGSETPWLGKRDHKAANSTVRS